MKIENILVSQDGVHTASQITGMIKFVEAGGIFNKECLQAWADKTGGRVAPLITLNEFPDGMLLLQDGHHRTLSILMGGRDFLYPDEFALEHWTYENYAGINFTTGWVTPHDPKTEIRLQDFKNYKNIVFDMLQRTPPDEVKDFIRKNKHLYAKPRTISRIRQLAEVWALGGDYYGITAEEIGNADRLTETHVRRLVGELLPQNRVGEV